MTNSIKEHNLRSMPEGQRGGPASAPERHALAASVNDHVNAAGNVVLTTKEGSRVAVCSRLAQASRLRDAARRRGACGIDGDAGRGLRGIMGAAPGPFAFPGGIDDDSAAAPRA